jgi:hypothetical protein
LKNKLQNLKFKEELNVKVLTNPVFGLFWMTITDSTVNGTVNDTVNGTVNDHVNDTLRK